MGADAFRSAYGTNRNGANAFGKCVSKMARLKGDAARAAAVVRIDDAPTRCAERTTSGKGKKAGTDDDGKGHGKAKGHGKGRAEKTPRQVPARRPCEVRRHVFES